MACRLRQALIAQALDNKAAFMVIDVQGSVRLFGPASADECRLFIHRAAARDALAAIGRFAPAVDTAAAFMAGNGALHAV